MYARKRGMKAILETYIRVKGLRRNTDLVATQETVCTFLIRVAAGCVHTKRSLSKTNEYSL